MAKLTLILEDGIKDGNKVVTGGFQVEDAPQPIAPNMPVESTPAQLYMTAIQRMWECDAFTPMLRLAVPDLLYRNKKLQEAKERMESGGMPIAPPAANQDTEPPADVPDAPVGATPGAAVEDAEPEAPPAAPTPGDLKLVG